MKNEKVGIFGGLSNLLGRTQGTGPGPNDHVAGKPETPPAGNVAAVERPSSHRQIADIAPNRELVDVVQIGQSHPCHRCPAPCCRLVMHDAPRPASFMDVDYMRFVLIHNNAEIFISRTDAFTVGYWGSCRNLDESSFQCKVHQKPEQPRTCVYYNPYNCFYKRNFVGEHVVDILRLNLPRFDAWMKELMFDSDGKLIFVPTFEKSIELVKDIPLELKLELLPEGKGF